MSRRIKTVKITDNNRDKDKQFKITEMPPLRGERWARRAVQAVLRANPDLGDALTADSGTPMVELAKIGFKALGCMDDETADSLSSEMLECVEVLLPDGVNTRKLMHNGDDIEEITTLFELRKQIFILHTGFFSSGE